MTSATNPYKCISLGFRWPICETVSVAICFREEFVSVLDQLVMLLKSQMNLYLKTIRFGQIIPI